MKDLDEIRAVIDECDREIVENLQKRFHAVKEVISYKKSKDLPILQPSREEAVLRKIEGYQDSEEFLKEIREIYIYIMEKSKEIQKKS